MSEFNAQSTADDIIAGISLVGRVAVVTGASAGLGVETARVLAGAGATVALLARDAARLAPVLEQLAAALPQAQLDSAIVDLADLDSVRGCAAELLERYPRIHLLINNAGVMACPQLRTAQGFEMQFGTNHLGHFLLTGLLLPALLAAAEEGGGESRVVSLSSSGHKLAAADLQDPNFERTDYDKFIAYGQSKSANSLFAVGLDRRFKDRSVRAFAVHPGMIMTDLGRHMSQADVEELMAIAPPGETLVVKSVEQGAATSVWAASSPDLAGQGGIYLENCQVAKPAGPGGDGGFMPHAADPEAAESLWELSEELVGQKF
jgi:NAD(P)-dependent dehydrogenase (short-subunit alcohol dehydrogenase family)